MEHSIQQQKIYFFFNLTLTITKINHIPGYKRSLNTFKKMQVIQNMFFDHNGIKLEINRRILCGKIS